MLNKLIIKNIALIKELEVDLSGGMNVLTGETGAGKSIIVDSVNLALGERADRELIRTGASKAVVEAWFSDVKKSVTDILESQQIEPESELVLSRELSTSGKNTCRINGVLVTLSVLKSISDELVDIHGQHEHQSLLNEKQHIKMLDSFDEKIDKRKVDTAKAYAEFSSVKKRLKSLFGNDGDRERRIDMLRFQIDEIEKAKITRNEEQELTAQKKRLNAQEKIIDVLNECYESLYQSDSSNILAPLKNISNRVKTIEDIDKAYEDIGGKVDEAYYALEEIALTVRQQMDMCVFDANALEEIEERLALITSLTRKYQDASIDGEYLQNAKQELDDLIGSEKLVEELSQKAEKLKTDLYKKSMELSELRRETAKIFEKMIMQQLIDLGMASASFGVHFQDTKSIDECVFSRNGIDCLEFFISTNRGEPQKPLRKIVSGGEVSRIMLALKNIAADKGGVPTMIFDEIDTGISGKMAHVVAVKLENISTNRQVVCVTHLPQIASMADRHFLILKQSDEISTTTYLHKLDDEERIEEIARLAGGDSSVTKQHARQMLQSAKSLKTTI